jgi:hypothetical protein
MTYLMNTQVQKLFIQYAEIHPTKLNVSQFSLLLKLFPSLIVCMSDGRLDPGEKEGLLKNLYTMTFSFEELTGKEQIDLYKNFVSDVFYQLNHLDELKHSFLETIKVDLLEHPADKEFIYESLYLFANINKGISIEEQLTIDLLVNDLRLAS